MCRLQAAIYFKNSVTKRWCLNCNETDPENSAVVISIPVNPEEKAAIRQIIIQALLNSEEVISKQFAESNDDIGV